MTYTAEQIMENRRRWASALRSGEYDQGRNLLRTTRGAYCCLGVACVAVAGKEIPPCHDQPNDYELVCEVLGINDDQMDAFVAANDSGEMTFAHIADMVDALPAPEVTP